ncbi:T-cell surface glycoprotein CD3 zeta chain isoform X2 [Bos indicus]|uniref:T-cell surface glycoprotein CD3 zeta chain n=1 Tax=Bos indicus TaxID=9915 RepID=A0ABM4RSH7_BOSIN
MCHICWSLCSAAREATATRSLHAAISPRSPPEKAHRATDTQHSQQHKTAQSFGLLDPKLCYLLDGILFIYGVIVTALFLRAKFSRSANAPAYQQGQNPVYNELNVGRREEYAVLDRRGGFDPEKGGKPRKKNPNEVVYNELRKDKMAEAYSEIGMKSDNQRRRGKGHDGLYQGLSTATKDTYDALHMQALPPR